jgi:DNA-binding response OmpR family regulator
MATPSPSPLKVLILTREGDPSKVAIYLGTQNARSTEVNSLFAARVALSQPYDCIVLDLRSSETTVQAVRTMRQHTAIPLLAIMPDRDAFDRVAVLEAGADDSISTPYVERELLARIFAAVRRSHMRAH